MTEDFNFEDFINEGDPIIDNNDPTPIDDSITDPTPKDEPAEGDSNEPKEGEDPSIFDVFVQNGILSLPENFEFDGSEESINKLIEHSSKSQKEKVYNELLSQFPEDARKMIEYAKNGGDIREFFYTAQEFDDLANIDLSTLDNQKKILTHYYKTTSKHPDDRIQRIIDKLEATGTLEESAVEAVEDLNALKQQKLDDMIKAKEDAKKDREQQLLEYTKNVNKVIEESALESSLKGKIKSFIFDPVQTDEGIVNKYYLTLSQIEKNPSHLVQLSELLADYDPEKGLQLTAIKQKATNKGLEQVKNLLQRNLNNSNSLKGKASPSSDSNFNFEDFANS